LRVDLGATPRQDLAFASGCWFLLPLRRCNCPLVGRWIQSATAPNAASLLLNWRWGRGCAFGGGNAAAAISIWRGADRESVAAPVLMAAYYIFAREFARARLSWLASWFMVGVATSGTRGRPPIQWRLRLKRSLRAAPLGALHNHDADGRLASGVSWCDPPTPEGEATWRCLASLRSKALWFLPFSRFMSVSYARSAALRGFWIGPYFEDVFGGMRHQSVGYPTDGDRDGYAAALPTARLDAYRQQQRWVIRGHCAQLLTLIALVIFPRQRHHPCHSLDGGDRLFGATYAVDQSRMGAAFMATQLIGPSA